MSKRPKVTTDTTPLSSNPFAALLPEIGDIPDGPSPSPTRPTDDADGATEPAEAEVDLGRRLVVRRQKRGQGGKTVTCVEGLPASALAEILPRIKRELGCSGREDAAVLVLGTGDHGRVADWLRQAGATRVVLGN